MYRIQCTVYIIQCTVYSIQCTVWRIQYTVYSVQCAVYSSTKVRKKMRAAPTRIILEMLMSPTFSQYPDYHIHLGFDTKVYATYRYILFVQERGPTVCITMSVTVSLCHYINVSPRVIIQPFTSQRMTNAYTYLNFRMCGMDDGT